ncbi:MAG: phosphate-starvation-inducible PsiE family protein [Alphaproteobacteria bacterium]
MNYNRRNDLNKNDSSAKNDKKCKSFLCLETVLSKIIRFSVSLLAILMTIMILFGVIDVAKSVFHSFDASSGKVPGINELLASFGSFMAVLIAIEILINITVYLQDNFIHTRIVMATALIAIARKVIVMDVEKTAPEYAWAIAAIILTASIGYWITMISPEENERKSRFSFNKFYNRKNYNPPKNHNENQ